MCNAKENNQTNTQMICNKALEREKINFLEEQNVGETPARYPWT